MLLFELGALWAGKSVLEIGCGTGRLAAHLARHGANVHAVDYSHTAIEIARRDHPGPHYLCGTLADVSPQRFDRIVLQGVLEHMDDPWERLSEYVRDRLAPGGLIVTSSPNLLNPRGYVWQTLKILLDVPMSLTDLHVITPWDMQEWADAAGLPLYYISCHQDWGSGQLMLEDYRRRLPKALADAGLPTERVGELLTWLERAATHFRRDHLSGATMAYRIGPATG